MKKVLIRVDGGQEIGMGHIMRMLTLGKKINKHFNVKYVCRNESSGKYRAGIEKIKTEGFNVITIPESNIIDSIVNIQSAEKADLLITDSYDVNEAYFDTLAKYFNKTAYVDDTNICRMNVDVVLNQNISAFRYKYNTSPNNNTKLLLGPKYLLLRDEFLKYNDKKINPKVKDIMLTVGGMDDKQLTLKVLKVLLKFNISIHVIIGKAFHEDLKEKIEILKNNYSNIITYENANMAQVMDKCDLAVSGCGSTLYELMVMKVPTIGIVIADNQEEVAKVMGDKHMIINSKKLIYENENEFSNILCKVIYDYDLRKEIVTNNEDYVKECKTDKIEKVFLELLA